MDKYPDDENPYLRCHCIVNRSAKKYISFADAIKRKREWEALGFKIKIDKFGNCKTTRKHVYFRQPDCNNGADLEAIKTGKKCTTNPRDVLTLLNRGCAYGDFASITEDIKFYHQADEFFMHGQFDLALAAINKAILINPNESLYGDLSIEIRFSSNDISAIDDDIAHQLKTYGSVTSMVHSGRAERWLMLLYRLDQTQKASEFESAMNRLFEVEMANQSVYKKPLGVKYIVNGSEKAGEQLALNAHQNAINFISSKKEEFNNYANRLRQVKTPR